MEELYENLISFEIDGGMVELFGQEETVIINGEVVYYREGAWYEKDHNGDYMADFSLTWFYTDKNDPQNYLYYESDTPEVSIRNLKHHFGCEAVHYVLDTKLLEAAGDKFIKTLAKKLVMSSDRGAAIGEIFALLMSQHMIRKVKSSKTDISAEINEYFSRWVA